MQIGIHKISFYVPRYYLDLNKLAFARNIDPLKYTSGLMQEQMAVAPSHEDIISMGANAALNILTKEDIRDIDLLLFATETGTDYSKAAASNLLEILKLNHTTQIIELKQACYAATAAISFAKGHILQNPNSKVLIIASDIAKYGIRTDGEPTQGAGSVAMIISKNPHIAVIEKDRSIHAENIYDFYRPNNETFAIVDGAFSNQKYIEFFKLTYEELLKKTGYKLADFSAITFHIPYAKIGLKSLKLIANEVDNIGIFNNYEKSVIYNKKIGNIYTGSLYLSLISLIENSILKPNSRIGLFSYGSGAIGEFYTIKIKKGYQNYINNSIHKDLLENRFELSIEEYEEIINYKENLNLKNSINDNKYIYLKEIINGKRIYTKKNI